MRRISTPNIHNETFDNVGETLCPQCGKDQVFSLVVADLAVSTTHHLVCNDCGYKTAITRKTALDYMPRDRPVWERHPHLILWLLTLLATICSATVVLI